jgi:hypothetical protein
MGLGQAFEVGRDGSVEDFRRASSGRSEDIGIG